MPDSPLPPPVPATVEEHDPDGVDYAWVMQTTFVLTIVVGAPAVAAVAVLTGVSLPTWTAMALFAVRVGALVWFVTAVGVFLYARRTTQNASADREDDAERDD
ncbi:MAG: DUF5822 domain-containing protein [Halarchaeum sp.]